MFELNINYYAMLLMSYFVWSAGKNQTKDSYIILLVCVCLSVHSIPSHRLYNR